MSDDLQAPSATVNVRDLRMGLLQGLTTSSPRIPGDIYLVELTQLQPDLIIIDADSDARDVLEDLVMVSRDAPRPIVLFSQRKAIHHNSRQR